jgi:nucleoside 2-deoxyribosyltransferase
MKYVYLAGPILGCTKDEANDWRKWVDSQVRRPGLVCISPLRCEPIIGERYTNGYADDKFGSARAIGSKNLFDTKSCDMVLAYLPTPEDGRSQSLGTILEIGWAHALGKPVILVSTDPKIIEHPVMNSCASWVLPDLVSATEVIKGILDGYVGGKSI